MSRPLPRPHGSARARAARRGDFHAQRSGRAEAVALFVVGGLLLNFPLLALWDRDATVLGLPLFPAALFVLWAGLIALLGSIVERMPD